MIIRPDIETLGRHNPDHPRYREHLQKMLLENRPADIAGNRATAIYFDEITLNQNLYSPIAMSSMINTEPVNTNYTVHWYNWLGEAADTARDFNRMYDIYLGQST